jgi:hypothetical protein
MLHLDGASHVGTVMHRCSSDYLFLRLSEEQLLQVCILFD